MAEIDWDALEARVQQPVEQSDSTLDTQTSVDEKAEIEKHMSFLKSKPAQGVQKAINPTQNTSELGEIGKDLKRAFYSKVATGLDAFGQFDASQEWWDLYRAEEGLAKAPEFGELPSIRFLKQTAIEEGSDLTAKVGLLALPVVGKPLFVADLVMSMYGESRKNIKDKTGEDQPYAAAAPAAVNVALESFTPMKILNKAGIGGAVNETLQDVINSDLFKPVLKRAMGYLKTGVFEGVTEVVQNLVNESTVRILTDTDILAKLTPEDKNDLWADFWAGLSAGASADAVISGVSTIQAKKRIKEMEETLKSDKAILESLETNKPVKPKVRINADGTVVKPRQKVPAEESTNPDAPVAEGEQPQAVPLDDLLDDPAVSQQDQRIADAVSSLPEDERQTAINALRKKISELETTLDGYRGLTEDDTTDDLNTFMRQEANNRTAQGYVAEPTFFPLTWIGQTEKFMAIEPLEDDNGDSIQSSLDPINSALSPVQILGDPQTIVSEDFEVAKDTYEFLKSLGLDKNPVTGEPMSLIYHLKEKPLDDNIGTFSVIDKNTLYLLTTRSKEGRTGLDRTAIHEIGHMMATQVMTHANEKQLARMYNKWQEAISSVSAKEAYYRKYAPTYLGKTANTSKITSKDKTEIGLSSYSTSLQEFIAEQFMLAMAGNHEIGKGFRQEAPGIYNGIRQAFTKLYKQAKDLSIKDVGDKTFKDFIEFIGTSLEVQELRAQERQLIRDQKAAKEASDLVDKVDIKETKNKQVTQSNLDKIDPETDAGKVVGLLTGVGLHKQAEEVSKIVDINMGFLGTGVLGKMFRTMLTPLQIAEQAGKKGFNLPTKYMELIQSFQVTKMKIIQKADTRLRAMRGLGTDGLTRTSRALYLISTRSDEVKRRLTSEELSKVFSQLKMDEQDITEWQEMDKFMLEMVDSLEAAMMYDAAKIYLNDRGDAKKFRDEYLAAETKAERETLIEQYTGQPIIDISPDDSKLFNPLWEAAESVRKQIDSMRHRNYFPRSRMGEYAVKVVGQQNSVWENVTAKVDNQTLGFYAFDTEAEQRAFIESIADDMGNGLKATGYKMDSVVFSVMGMPSGMIDQIKRNVEGLTKTQEEQLGDIALQRSPGRKFLRHLTKRRGVAGYSEDALRVFANYASSGANHVARAEWASDLTDSIGEMEHHIQNIPADAVVVNDLNTVKEYFVKHLDYVMRPDNDWARLRAMGFLYYLGFNAKSAAVNFMQTPMVLYPALAAHTSDKNAVRRISGAMKDAVSAMRGGKELDPDVMNTVQHMIEAGLIDESMVSELAGLSEGNSLKRLVPGFDLKSKLDQFAHAGGFMFRVGEKYNRYVTAIAAHRVAKDNGLEGDDVIKFARDMIQGSQFEYARWNRAEFMRGRQSVLFLFWQYMQHANYLMFGGKGSKTATRMWVMALMIAGIEGLPFAEFVLDFLDIGGSKIKQMLGVKNPRVSLRNDLREIITQIHDRPDDILKGFSYQYGLGPLHAASLLGVPIPNVSTRGSLSYGNPVPWFDGLTDPTITSGEKLLAKTVAAVAGPVGGMGLGVIDALYSKDPDNWKRWEKVLPLFMRNASTGIRWAAQGGETDSTKAKILTFTTPEERAEMVLKGLGFQPTRVDQTRQQIRAAQVPILYTQIRREELIRQLDYAILTKNKEGKADVKKAIRDFNKGLGETGHLSPYKIPVSTLTRAMHARNKKRKEKEAGRFHGKKGVPTERAVEKLYPIDEN